MFLLLWLNAIGIRQSLQEHMISLGQHFGHHTAWFDTHPCVLVTSLHGLYEASAPVLCQGASALYFRNEGRWVVTTGRHRSIDIEIIFLDNG